MVQGNFDIVIIGAGAVGLSTAMHLKQMYQDLKIVVIEKESKVAAHQTGNNSGVIHSGIYYKPGSLKALNCKQGYDMLLQFCSEHGIPFDICGKVIVATNQKEMFVLDNIYKRGVENGLNGIEILKSEEVKEIEPYVSSVAGIWVPQTGIISYRAVTEKYREVFEGAGGEMLMNAQVIGIRPTYESWVLETSLGTYGAKYIVNCAGLYSDKVAKMTMPEIDVKIIPFRGEYYELVKEKEYLVRNLIYPVPNPDFPFLGVHYTRMIEGGVEAGPNAVLAFKREGYRRTDFQANEFLETMTYSGFRKVAMKYWRDGLGEIYRSFSKPAFVRALRHLIPELQESDLVPGGSGVRAQAIDSNGNLVDDFLIFESKNVVNVCNAPSPAATASLAVGKTIAERLVKHVD